MPTQNLETGLGRCPSDQSSRSIWPGAPGDFVSTMARFGMLMPGPYGNAQARSVSMVTRPSMAGTYSVVRR